MLCISPQFLLFSVVCFGVLAQSCTQVNQTTNFSAKENQILLSLAVKQLLACTDRHNIRSHTTRGVGKSKHRHRYIHFSNRRLPKPLIAYAPMSLVLLLIHISGESLGCATTTSCPSNSTTYTWAYDEHSPRQITTRSTPKVKLQTSTITSVPTEMNKSTDSSTVVNGHYQTHTFLPVITNTYHQIPQSTISISLVTTPTKHDHHTLTPPPVTQVKASKHGNEPPLDNIYNTYTWQTTYKMTILSYSTQAYAAQTGPCHSTYPDGDTTPPHNIAALVIALSGDVESNPGPVRFPCGICTRVKSG